MTRYSEIIDLRAFSKVQTADSSQEVTSDARDMQTFAHLKDIIDPELCRFRLSAVSSQLSVLDALTDS